MNRDFLYCKFSTRYISILHVYILEVYYMKSLKIPKEYVLAKVCYVVVNNNARFKNIYCFFHCFILLFFLFNVTQKYGQYIIALSSIVLVNIFVYNQSNYFVYMFYDELIQIRAELAIHQNHRLEIVINSFSEGSIFKLLWVTHQKRRHLPMIRERSDKFGSRRL
jgi:hypothetical protein